jgi:hypothetical protein
MKENIMEHQIPDSHPNEDTQYHIEAFIKITDPETGEVLLEERA